MKRLSRILREYAWLLAFSVCVLPVIAPKADAQWRIPPVLQYGVRPGYSVISLEYPAPPEYEDWWKEIATCENLPLPPIHTRVRFFAIAAREFWPLFEPGWAIGYAHAPSGQLYL